MVASSSRQLRSWTLVAALLLASVWTGDTRPGDDFLTAAVIPSAAPASSGAWITVAGINFNPGGVFGAGGGDGGGGFEDYDDDDDYFAGGAGGGGGNENNAGGGMACVFGGDEGAATSSVAEVRGGSSLACVVPRGIASGFVSVGISGNGGVDAKFFHYDEVMMNFASVGEMSSAVGPGVWARGDPVFITGRGMIPREANAAVVGQSLPCGWWAKHGADVTASSSGGGSPGAFVSSALRQCEAPAVADFARVVAMTEPAGGTGTAWHAVNTNIKPSSSSAPSSGPVVAVAEPPQMVGVRPGATTAEGGGVLVITTTGTKHHASRALLLARVGTTRVALDAAASGGDSWRCVAPAHNPTSTSVIGTGGGGPMLGGSTMVGSAAANAAAAAGIARANANGGGVVNVALMATHFGAGNSEWSDATGVCFVPAPRAGLVGGPAAGAADAAVPTPAGALFRLFFSPLPPRSLPLWCVVGSGGGGARFPTSAAASSRGYLAECTPAEGMGAGFATVTLLWAGGDAAGAATGQVMYAPRPRVLAASPAAAAAAGGGGAAPVTVIGSDMMPLPGGAGGSGGVACVVGGRAAASEVAWVSSALILCDLSSSLVSNNVVHAGGSSSAPFVTTSSVAAAAATTTTTTTTTGMAAGEMTASATSAAASGTVPLVVATAPLLVSASSASLAVERGGAAAPATFAEHASSEDGGAALLVAIVGASSPNEAADRSDGDDSGDSSSSGGGSSGPGPGSGVGGPLPNCRLGTISPLSSRPVHAGYVVECTAPAKPAGTFAIAGLAWPSRAEYWGPATTSIGGGIGGGGGPIVEYLTPPRSLAAVPSGVAASGGGGAGHHAALVMAMEPAVLRRPQQRRQSQLSGGVGGGGGGWGGSSFECVLTRGGALAPRAGVLAHAPWGGGGDRARGGGRVEGGRGRGRGTWGDVETCLIHVGGATPGFSVLSITAPLGAGGGNGGGGGSGRGDIAFAAGVAFHVASAPQVRTVQPPTAPAGNLVAAAVVHVLAENLLRDGDGGVVEDGGGVTCEFRLTAAAAAAAAAACDGDGDCATATHVSTAAHVVSSAHATCEAPEARSSGAAPVRISLAASSSAVAATFVFIGSPDPVASSPSSGPSLGGSVVAVLGGGVGSSSATLNNNRNSSSAASAAVAAAAAAAEGMAAGAACGFGTVGPVAGRILAGSSGISGRSYDLECVSPAGAGGTAVDLRVRSGPGSWAIPHGPALSFYYEMSRGGDASAEAAAEVGAAGGHGGRGDATSQSASSSLQQPLARGLVGSSGRAAVAWLAASSAVGGIGDAAAGSRVLVYRTWCITSASGHSGHSPAALDTTAAAGVGVAAFATPAIVISSSLVACETPAATMESAGGGAAAAASSSSSGSLKASGIMTSTRLSARPWDPHDGAWTASGDAAAVGVVRVTVLASPPGAVTATVSTARGLIAARVEGDANARAHGPAGGGTKIIVKVGGVWDEAAASAGVECGFGTVAPVLGYIVPGARGERGGRERGRVVECVSPAGVEGASVALRVRAAWGPWSDFDFTGGGSIFTYDRAAPAGGSSSHSKDSTSLVSSSSSFSWLPPQSAPVLLHATLDPTSSGEIVWLSGSAFGDGGGGGGSSRPLLCHVSRVASGTSADALHERTSHPAAYVVSSALALCEAPIPPTDAVTQLRLRVSRGWGLTSSSISSSANNLNGGRRAIDASDDTSMASSFMSEAAARLTLRAPPRVLSISPNHGAAEGGTAVIARWVKRTAVAASSLSEAGGKGDASGEGVGMELDGGAAACRFGTLGPIRGWVIAGGAGVECVAPAGKATRSFGGNDATVTVSVRAGTSGWSDTPSSPTSPSSSFTYASVWKPQQAVPRFVAALPAGGGGEADALREGSGSALGGGATVLLLGRGFPPLSDPAAACAGMPRAAVLAVGYGRALCKVAVDVAAAADAGGMEAMPGPAPFAVSFVITAAPVVLLAVPDAAPAAAAAAAAAPTPVWVQGYNLHPTDAAATTSEPAVAGDGATLHCCFTRVAGSASSGGGGSRCTPARAVSSALASCEPPSYDVDAGPALLTVSAGAGVAGGGGGGRGVSFELLGAAAVPVAASTTPSVGPAEGGTAVLVTVNTVDGVSGGLQGADAPECRFGSIWPVAGRLASRGGAVACVSPAAARTPKPAPTAARGRPSAAAWGSSSSSSSSSSFARFRGTADGTAAGGSADLDAFTALPPTLPLDHPALLAVPLPHPGPGWNVLDQSQASRTVRGEVRAVDVVVVMAEMGPRLNGVVTAPLSLAGGGAMVWIHGADLTSGWGSGGGLGGAAVAAVLRRAHRSGSGYGSITAPIMTVSSTVAVFEAPPAPPGAGPVELLAAHPSVGASPHSTDISKSHARGVGSGVVMVIVPEAPANVPPKAPSTAPPTAVTTEGGDVVTVATTLGAAAAVTATCRVGVVGPMGARVGADGDSGGGGSGEVECVVPARAPGDTTAVARPAAASWPESATGALTRLAVRLVPAVIAAVAADGGLALAAAALGGAASAARFTLFGYHLPTLFTGTSHPSSATSCFARMRPSPSSPAYASGITTCNFAGLSGQGFTAVAAAGSDGVSRGGHPDGAHQGWRTTLPQIDVRAPPVVYAAHASAGPSGGGSIAHLRGAWSFGGGGGGGGGMDGGGSAGSEAGTALCIFAGTPVNGNVGTNGMSSSSVVTGAAVVVSSVVASCEVPAWPGGVGEGGTAAVSITRSSAEDASAALLSSAAATTTGGSGGGGDPVSASGSFHFTPELAVWGGAGSGPSTSPDAGSSGGGALVVLSGVSAGATSISTSTWRCWFGSVGPVLGAAAADGAGCVSPAHAAVSVPVRACPAPSCGNGGDFGAASGAVFSYVHPGELLTGDYAAVPGSRPTSGVGSVLLLVGWGLDARRSGTATAVAAAAAGGGVTRELGAVGPAGGGSADRRAVALVSPPLASPAACSVFGGGSSGGKSGSVVPALSVGSGAVACASLGSHSPGFHAVMLLTAGGSVSSTPLMGAQVEFAESAAVVSAAPALGPLGGGGIVWISGASLHRAAFGVGGGGGWIVGDSGGGGGGGGGVVSTSASPCSFGRGNIAVGTLVSSGLVACEAPPAPPPAAHSSSHTSSHFVFSAGHGHAAKARRVARAVPLTVITAGGGGGGGGGSASSSSAATGRVGGDPNADANSVAYTYIPEADVSTLEPSTGPVYGGTRLRVRLQGGGDGGVGAGACRFGPIVVSASVSDEDLISCTAPARRPGWTDLAVGSSGAACDSTGAGFLSGGRGGARYRYHALD